MEDYNRDEFTWLEDLSLQIHRFASTQGTHQTTNCPLKFITYENSLENELSNSISIKKNFEKYPKPLLHCSHSVLVLDNIESMDRIKIHHMAILMGAISVNSLEPVKSTIRQTQNLRTVAKALILLRNHYNNSTSTFNHKSWVSILNHYDAFCTNKDGVALIKGLLHENVSHAQIQAYTNFLIKSSKQINFCLLCFYEISAFVSKRLSGQNNLPVFIELVNTMSLLLDAVIEEHPTNPEYLFQKARISIMLGSQQEAEAYWNQALLNNINPSRVSYLLWVSWFLNKPKFSEAFIQTISEFEDETPVESHLLWITLLLVGEDILAERHYIHAIRKYPNLRLLCKGHPFDIHFPLEMLGYKLGDIGFAERMRASYESKLPQLLDTEEQKTRAIQERTTNFKINLIQLL